MDARLAAMYERGRSVLAGGTTSRFLVLFSVLLVSSLLMFTTMALALRPASFADCVVAAAEADPRGRIREISLADNATFAACRSQVAATAGRYAAAGTGAVLLAAVLLYWWYPSWRRRRHRLLPVTAFRRCLPMEDPRTAALDEELARLSRHAGLSRPPEFVVDPRAMAVGAVAFGRAGRYTVCVNAGLIPRRFTEPGIFEAVALHELAHVRRRDVDLAYLTVIFWRVLLFAVLLPYLAVLGWRWLAADVPDAPPATWANATPTVGKVVFGLALAALVYLARAEVMRCREMCADLDAVLLGADPAVWGSPHLARPGGVKANPAVAVARWFAGQWRGHPTWQQRHRLLTGTAPLRTGVSFLQTVLTASACLLLLLVPLAAPWPQWLFATVVYLTGPLTLFGMLAHTPSKNPSAPIRLRLGAHDPPYVPVAPRIAPAGRRPERRLMWGSAVFALVTGALLLLDPLGGITRDGRFETTGSLRAPPAYRPEPVSWPIPRPHENAARLRTELSAWLANGGPEAGGRLYRTITVAPADVTPAVRAKHCAAARRAATDAAAHGAPDAFIRRDWQILVLAAYRGNEVLCAGRPAGGGAAETEAARYYSVARRAYDTVAVWTNLHAPGSLPN